MNTLIVDTTKTVIDTLKTVVDSTLVNTPVANTTIWQDKNLMLTLGVIVGIIVLGCFILFINRDKKKK
jgi:hypothetical protein